MLGDCDGTPAASTGMAQLTAPLTYLWCRPFFAERPAMAVTKDIVREQLGRLTAPDGRPLTATNALSDIVVSDGKVFFSLTVDAAAVQQWEPVRKQAEEAVRTLPEVKSVLVALTPQRAARAPAAHGGAPPGQGPMAGPHAPPAPAGPPAPRNSRGAGRRA